MFRNREASRDKFESMNLDVYGIDLVLVERDWGLGRRRTSMSRRRCTSKGVRSDSAIDLRGGAVYGWWLQVVVGLTC